MKEKIIYDCSVCPHKYIAYKEYDTGYEEWSCELLEELYDLSEVECYDSEESLCPLNIEYEIRS